MENVTSTASPTENRTAGQAWLLLGLVVILLVAAGFLAYRLWSRQMSAESLPETQTIAAQAFEKEYGLRVRLIGVTAGGGKIDFRLKIIEPEKSQAFMRDPAHSPSLIDVESGTALTVSGGIDEDLPWEKDGILFFLVPNSGGAIQPGDEVIVAFGDLLLEPTLAQ